MIPRVAAPVTPSFVLLDGYVTATRDDLGTERPERKLRPLRIRGDSRGITDHEPQFFPMKAVGPADRVLLAKGRRKSQGRDHPPAADSTDGPP